MNLRSLFIGFLLSLLTFHLGAQEDYYDFGFERNASVSVTENSHTLALPWAGGMNSVHFSEIDLDLDGTPDLLGFEKQWLYIRSTICSPFPRFARLGDAL